MWTGFWTGDRHIALCKAIVTPVHSQLHCTAQCSCGEETFELAVEQRAVLSSNRPQLVLASSHTLGWPWQGVGQPFHFYNLVVQHQPPQCTKTAQCAASGFYRLPFTGFCHFLQFRSLYPTHTVSRSQYPSAMNGKQCVVTLTLPVR